MWYLINAIVTAMLTFANVPQERSDATQLASLRVVLAQYDREIAALRATETMPGLNAIATEANADAAALQRDADEARAHASAMAAHAAYYQRREQHDLQSVSSGGVSSYGQELASETAGTLDAYRAAMALRTQRAYNARAQQLRERESTLAFDLERANAGARVLIVAKLEDLRLDPQTRERLARKLAALDAHIARSVDAARSSDIAELGAYGARLNGEAAASIDRMTADLRAKAAANLAVRRGVPSTDTAALRAGYRFATDAAALDSGFSGARDDLTRRFALLADEDRDSRNALEARIAALSAQRDALYRAIEQAKR